MPVTTFLFARGDPELERAFLAHPRWSKATYRLDRCEGLSVGPGGLLAVDLEDDSFSLWDGPERPAFSSRAITLEPMCRKYSWARQVLPSMAELDALIELSQRTGRAVGWFFWHERGDDLYNDAAWLFDPSTHHDLGSGISFTSKLAGELAWARQTFLMGAEGGQAWHVEDGKVVSQSFSGSPFSELMLRLGMLASTQYFVPADSSAFDWASHQLKVRD